MLRGQELSLFIARLEERRASLYHACQLRDFQSYLAVGGIPSRRLLERESLAFTAFETDWRDKENRVWTKVFLNLQDFGKLFDHGRNAVPNPYGPILIRLAPKVLESAKNVAVCLRSAGARGFDRKREALTLEETERVFETSRSPKIRPPWGLRETFEQAQSPELSCAVDGQVLPCFGPAQCLIEEIKVDPCRMGRALLRDAVRKLCEQHSINASLVVRMGTRGYRKHYRNVVESLRALPRNPVERDLEKALARLAVSDHDRTRRWARRVQRTPKIRRQFKRFIRYLVEGTLATANAYRSGSTSQRKKRRQQ